MADPETPASAEEAIGVTWLTPANTTLERGEFGLIDCTANGTFYRGVHAVLLFPVRQPNRNVSIRYFDEKSKEQEIGVIPNLKEFPEEQQRLVREQLSKHYYEQIIRNVYEVENEYGLLFFDVETQRGREQFVMPWRGDCAEDYGERGKVLHESLGNRYIVPDVEELPPSDRQRFTTYIYW